MELFFKKYGEHGKELVILHGLFGSSRNWISIAMELSRSFQVYTLDLRNHGDSAHSEEHSLEAMALDLNEFFLKQNISNPVLMGHSMGGVLASYYALSNPLRVRKLIVVDILPKNYGVRFEKEFEALSLDLNQFTNRDEAEERIIEIVGRPEVGRFLAMNIEKNQLDPGEMYWRINRKALQRYLSEEHLPSWMDLDQNPGSEGHIFREESLFVFGTASPFYQSDYLEKLKILFPKAKIDLINDGTHWLHFTHKEEFLDQILYFLGMKE